MRAIWKMSAVETAEATRSGRLSSAEVAQAHCERFEAVNPTLNAVTVDRARARSRSPGRGTRRCGPARRPAPSTGCR